ncbi:MAG: ABC transporter permease [Gorillibacterium sp.]|nr:ABC transporter permease [Gorillibacterium sp.]
MMGRVLAADFLKLRRTMVWFLVFLGPIGVIALEAVNFGLRYDYLTKNYADDLWGGLLENIQGMTALAILLGGALLASMVAGLEHRTNAWKQLLALPVTRLSVFVSKFTLCTLLLLFSSTLLTLGSYALGGILGFGWKAPWLAMIQTSFYPMLAGLAIVALQLWLSIMMKNQAIPMTAGILGTIVGLYSFKLPDWILWKWPLLINEAGSPEWSVFASVATALLLVLLGVIHFTRKDVD